MGTCDTLPLCRQGPPAPPEKMVSCTHISHLMHFVPSNAFMELIRRHLSLSVSGFQTPYIPPRSHSQRLPPKYSPHPWALPTPRPSHSHTPIFPGLSFPRPSSQPCPPTRQTHRVPFGAIITGGAFRPWWSGLSWLPRFSFLPTLPTWALEDEWRVQMVPKGS